MAAKVLRLRKRRRGRWPEGWWRWLVVAIMTVLMGTGTYVLLQPLAARDAWNMVARWTSQDTHHARRPTAWGSRRRGRRASFVEGFARVIDGDSLRVAGVEVRLHGIDAPEYRQTCRDAHGRRYGCGRRAAAHLRRLVGWHRVQCRRVTTDRYGRMVAMCKAGGRDIGRQMVLDGWAVAFVRYSRAYVSEERQARVARRGIWQGRFIMPSAWRRMKRRH